LDGIEKKKQQKQKLSRASLARASLDGIEKKKQQKQKLSRASLARASLDGGMMKALDAVLKRISAILNIVAAAALTFMMFLTVVDVGLRAAGRPIVGVYEIVALTLAVVVGFSMAQVSLDGAHVYMEIGLDKLGPFGQNVMKTFTRILCLGLFIFIGYNLFSVGAEFRTSGEVSQTLRLPFFPVAYAVGFCCFLQCLIFLMDIATIWRAEHE
jgi:TRAP-type C4-dicarboxylate transport system permease small subunit